MTSTLSNDTTETTASHPGIYIPTDIDNQPIKYEGNLAHLPGLLYEYGRWVNRTGHFKEFVEQGVVLMSSGKITLDSVNTVKFIRNEADDGDVYDIMNPCPATSVRMAKFDALADATSPASPKFATVATAPLDHSHIVQPLVVKKKDRQLAESILAMWEDADEASELQTECDGSGRELIKIILKMAQDATPADHGLVETQLDNFVKSGIIGSISLKSFNEFSKGYQKLNRRLLPSNRKQDTAEMQMYHTAIMKDRDLRAKYELKLELKSPTTIKEVLSIIRGMLRTDMVYSQLDDATNAVSATALTATQLAALATLGIKKSGMSGMSVAMIADAVAQHALAADPRKGGDGGGGNKRKGANGGEGDKQRESVRDKKPSNYNEWPRDEHGNITSWVIGMGLCGCTHSDGGKHPRAKCPLKKWEGTSQGEIKGPRTFVPHQKIPALLC